MKFMIFLRNKFFLVVFYSLGIVFFVLWLVREWMLLLIFLLVNFCKKYGFLWLFLVVLLRLIRRMFFRILIFL